jgi:membrane protease YdiL (CAAX protease family)
MPTLFTSRFIHDLKTLFQPIPPAEKKARWILLVAPVLLTIWVYYGKSVFFSQYLKFQIGIPMDVVSVIFEYLAFFLLMFCIPVLIVKLAWKQPLSVYGLQLGDWRAGLRILVVVLPFMLLGAIIGAFDPAMQAEYPLAKSMMNSLPLFLFVEAFYLVYYLSWEFFFRGFMQTGMQNVYSPVMAILIQTVPSAIVHIGKPFAECFSAIVAGWVFGYAAWRTRSIFYPMLLHAVVGIGTDIVIILSLQ